MLIALLFMMIASLQFVGGQLRHQKKLLLNATTWSDDSSWTPFGVPGALAHVVIDNSFDCALQSVTPFEVRADFHIDVDVAITSLRVESKTGSLCPTLITIDTNVVLSANKVVIGGGRLFLDNANISTTTLFQLNTTAMIFGHGVVQSGMNIWLEPLSIVAPGRVFGGACALAVPNTLAHANTMGHLSFLAPPQYTTIAAAQFYFKFGFTSTYGVTQDEVFFSTAAFDGSILFMLPLIQSWPNWWPARDFLHVTNETITGKGPSPAWGDPGPSWPWIQQVFAASICFVTGCPRATCPANPQLEEGLGSATSCSATPCGFPGLFSDSPPANGYIVPPGGIQGILCMMKRASGGLTVLLGCHYTDPPTSAAPSCNPSNCKHGSTCALMGDSCICSPSTGFHYTGPTCGTPVCDSGCLYDGQCIASDPSPYCACSSALRTGSLCEIPICPNDCSGHGSCLPSTEPPKCDCQPGWTSLDCSTAYTGCPPCLNGVCVNQSSCQCSAGWTGNECDIAVCPQDCSGHGVCSGATSPPTCGCYQGFFGSACNQTECYSTFCQDVATSCVVQGGVRQCVPSTSNSMTTPRLAQSAIIGISAAGAVLLAAVIVFLLWRYRLFKNAQHKKVFQAGSLQKLNEDKELMQQRERLEMANRDRQ